jgi:hypothetical protein
VIIEAHAQRIARQAGVVVVRTVALMVVRRVLGVLWCGPDANEVEIAVLRHQLAVLDAVQRQSDVASETNRVPSASSTVTQANSRESSAAHWLSAVVFRIRHARL